MWDHRRTKGILYTLAIIVGTAVITNVVGNKDARRLDAETRNLKQKDTNAQNAATLATTTEQNNARNSLSATRTRWSDFLGATDPTKIKILAQALQPSSGASLYLTKKQLLENMQRLESCAGLLPEKENLELIALHTQMATKLTFINEKFGAQLTAEEQAYKKEQAQEEERQANLKRIAAEAKLTAALEESIRASEQRGEEGLSALRKIEKNIEKQTNVANMLTVGLAAEARVLHDAARSLGDTVKNTVKEDGDKTRKAVQDEGKTTREADKQRTKSLLEQLKSFIQALLNTVQQTPKPSAPPAAVAYADPRPPAFNPDYR